FLFSPPHFSKSVGTICKRTSSSLSTFPEKNAKAPQPTNSSPIKAPTSTIAFKTTERQTDTMAASLGSLPADILVEILSSAQSIQDLQSLLLSSRSFHSAFQPYRYSITLPVVKAELGAANWRILLSIFHLSHGAYSPSQSSGKERLQLFVDHYRSNRPFDDPPNNAASFGQAMRIYKLYNNECGSFLRPLSELSKFGLSSYLPPEEISYRDAVHAVQQESLLRGLHRRLNNRVNMKMQLRSRDQEWRRYRLLESASALWCQITSMDYHNRIYSILRDTAYALSYTV
ncbi:hypothetical protein V8F06_009424, partial [Rhypophila decipiens]